MKKTNKINYAKCVRCSSVAMMLLDMGKMGKIALCPVCWIGLAGAFARDFEIYKQFDKDYLQELRKGYDREEWFKKQNKL